MHRPARAEAQALPLPRKPWQLRRVSIGGERWRSHRVRGRDLIKARFFNIRPRQGGLMHERLV
eukprot:6552853-Prymnesium_polylepis.1